MIADTPLACALKLADALSLLPQEDVPAALAATAPHLSLLARAGARRWLPALILDNLAALNIRPADLAAALSKE